MKTTSEARHDTVLTPSAGPTHGRSWGNGSYCAGCGRPIGLNGKCTHCPTQHVSTQAPKGVAGLDKSGSGRSTTPGRAKGG